MAAPDGRRGPHVRPPASAAGTCAPPPGNRPRRGQRRPRSRRPASRRESRGPSRSSACRRARRSRPRGIGRADVVRAPFADGVAVEARDARAGKQPRNLRLDPLGAEPGLFEVRPRAERTLRRHARCVIAVVAARALGSTVTMHHERHAAVRTLNRAGALPAEYGRREAAAIEQHERLLAPAQPIGHRRPAGPG